MHYLQSLNEPQRLAVEHTEGPLMVIAGAGSGKTRVLTYRIAYLIEHGVDPFNILSLTFTNKAAREMRERIEGIIGPEARNLWMGTFHSIFARMLRIEADKLGYDRNFTIYDADDSKSLIKKIVKERGLNDKLYKPNAVFSRISAAKNRLISWQKYLQEPFFISEDEQAGRPKLGEVYKEYAQRCFKSNAMDFDDLLYNTNVLFRDHLDVLNNYQHKFKYILIDEYQDTNFAQYLITRKLANIHQNICVVGDDAQSIYSFRGADISNILNFEKDYPELKTVKLEQNYRSTQNIVNLANSLIANNKDQLPKKVWTDNEDGALIRVMKAASDGEEGKLVASSIFEEKNGKGLSNKDFAVLYRTNAQSRAIEESLRRMNIPYKIIGGLSFYQRKEIKDLLAYMRYAVNPNDEEAFRRIVNLPKRGIGPSTVDKIVVMVNEQGLSLWEVVSNVKDFFPAGRVANPVGDFANLIKTFRIALQANDAYAVADKIAKNSGLLKELYDDKTVEGRVRYDNVQELLNAVKEFTDNPENEDKSMQAFLEQAALVSTADTEVGDDVVTLMTIHMSKGLEFDHLYVVGMEENLFPSQMMLGSREDLEEERRLFYVAITRARKQLTLGYALQRYRYGRLNPSDPSRFLAELNPKYLQEVRTRSAAESYLSDNFGNREAKVSARRQSSAARPKIAKTYSHTPSEAYKPTDPAQLQAGQRVEHPKFGYGQIRSLADGRVKVEFEQVGEKTLIVNYAKLMVCE